MSAWLRAARERVIADNRLGGRAFGRALSELVDQAFLEAAAGLNSADWALVALGSYARQELCPGSDLDVMLLHSRAPGRGSSALVDDAARLWYPFWDAGFVLGHSTRTVKEALAVADGTLDALTALLDVRVVAGDTALALDLLTRVRQLGLRRRSRLVDVLARAARTRHERPGPVAEMLEPNLKNGAGGLRDVQATGWAGWALEPAGTPMPDGWAGGVTNLVARGYLRPGDPERLADARDRLLDIRVALHRVTGGRSDQLTLQDHDALAGLLGIADADLLVRGLADAARSVAWITADLWTRLLAAERGPASRVTGTHAIGGGLIVRDGRVAMEGDDAPDATRLLRVAAKAAELALPIDRETLERFVQLGDVRWTPEARDAFIGALRAGRAAVPVLESLDQIGVLVQLLPEWVYVRARPQRNAYYRFTVDRHLLETVAECASLLEARHPEDDGFDGVVARRCRVDVLLLGALLHDIGKGRPVDRSAVGAELASAVARRIGVDDRGVELLE